MFYCRLFRRLENKKKIIIYETDECFGKCSGHYNYEYKEMCYMNSILFPYCINETYNNTKNFSSTNEYPLLISDKNTITEKEDENTGEISKQRYNNFMLDDILNFSKKEIEEGVGYYDTILEKFESIITSDYFDTSNLDNGENEVIETKKMTITLTTVQNQIKNQNNNITTMYLGKCESELRKYYNISNNDTIYMKRIEVKQEGMKIPKIEYDVYSKLLGENLTKLNISVCQNNIIISLPIPISENVDVLNISSRYYNDICYVATSDSDTDIILNDRKNEFIERNKTMCQDDCDFSNYNYISQKANCSCKIKKSSSSFAEIYINTTKLIENFKNVKIFLNLNILKCHKSLFNIKGILSNIGCYVMNFLIIFHIISSFIFYSKQLNIITNQIKEISFGIKNCEILKSDNITKVKKVNELNIRQNTTAIKKKVKKKNSKKSNKKRNSIINGEKEISKQFNKIEKESKFKVKRKSINNFIFNNNLNRININKNKASNLLDRESIRNIIDKKEKEVEQDKIVENIMGYNEDEINELSYELALENDRRTYCEYYISLLKTKHNLIFSFFYNRDYNSKIIKMDLFFVGFGIYYTVNALFFDDETLHMIYKNKGKFDFEYQLPKIIYSMLISIILNFPLKLLALSSKAIINFKKDKTISDVNEREKKLKKTLRIKFLLYFIISFIFLIFFWYYISIFGAIIINFFILI